jgi:hypothetical protein
MAERRPTLTASARAGVRNLRSGRKKACGAVEQKKAAKQGKKEKALAFVAAIRERKNARGAGRTKEWTQEASGQSGGCLPNMSSCQGSSSRVGVMIGSDGVFGRSGSPRIARRVPSGRPQCKRRLHRRRRIRAIGLSACASSCSFLALLVNLVLHAEALAFDDDGVGVMQDPVQDGGGQRAVVVEYL